MDPISRLSQISPPSIRWIEPASRPALDTERTVNSDCAGPVATVRFEVTRPKVPSNAKGWPGVPREPSTKRHLVHFGEARCLLPKESLEFKADCLCSGCPLGHSGSFMQVGLQQILFGLSFARSAV